MLVKSSLELVLYCFVYIPTLNKSYHSFLWSDNNDIAIDMEIENKVNLVSLECLSSDIDSPGRMTREQFSMTV
jgi:hypothetical protein